jgi:Ca2+-binding RTX toxin-like protein
MLTALQSARAVAVQGRRDAINTDSTSGVILFGHPDTSSAQGGNDVILGSAGDDVILGGGGTNYIDGRAGMDVLLGGNGTRGANGATTTSDILIGGGGFDRIIAGSKDSYLYATAPNDPATSLEQNLIGGGQFALQHIRTVEQREIKKFTQLDTDVVNEETDRAALNAFFSQAGIIPTTSPMYCNPTLAAQLIADCEQSTTATGQLRYPDPSDPTGNTPLKDAGLFTKLMSLYGSDPATNYTMWRDLLPKDHQDLQYLEGLVQQADNTVRDEYKQFAPGVSNTDVNLSNTPFYVLLGGDGNDTIFGSPDEDVINGGGGNNTVNWSPGNDVIVGGTDATKTHTFTVSGTNYNDTITLDAVLRTENTVDIQFTDPVTGQHIDTGKMRTDFLGINRVGVIALGGDDTVTLTDEGELEGCVC